MTKSKLAEIVVLEFIALAIAIFIGAYATGLWHVDVNSTDKYYDLDLSFNIGIEKGKDGYYVLDGESHEFITSTSVKWNQPNKCISIKYQVKDANGKQIDTPVINIQFFKEGDEQIGDTYSVNVDSINNYSIGNEIKYVKVITEGTSGMEVKIDIYRIGSRPVYNSWLEWALIILIVFAILSVGVFGLEKLLSKRNLSIPWEFPIRLMNRVFDKLRWLLMKLYIINDIAAAKPICKVMGCVAAFVFIYQIIVLKSSMGLKTLSLFIMTVCTAGGSMNNPHAKPEEKKYGINVNGLSIAYFWFALMIFVSEIIVGKTVFNVGYLYLIVYGFIAYYLSSSDNRMDFIFFLKMGLLLNFGYIIIQCVFMIHEIRTWGTAYYYSGVNYNSALFGISIIAPFTILLADMDQMLEEGKISVRYIGTCLLLGVAMMFLWGTQARTMFLVEVIMFIVFFGKIFICRRRYEKKWMLVAQLLIATVIIVVGWNLVLRGINNIALDGTKYELKLASGGMEVYAADGSRIFTTFTSGLTLDRITSGRLGMWKTYFKNITLLGHPDVEYCPTMKTYISPHNSLIWYAYEYGFMMVVPFITMIVMSVIYAIRYAKKHVWNRKMAMLPIYAVCVHIMLSLTETIDDVFHWYPASFMVYLCMIYAMSEYDTSKNSTLLSITKIERRYMNASMVVIASLVIILLKYMI